MCKLKAKDQKFYIIIQLFCIVLGIYQFIFLREIQQVQTNYNKKASKQKQSEVIKSYENKYQKLDLRQQWKIWNIEKEENYKLTICQPIYKQVITTVNHMTSRVFQDRNDLMGNKRTSITNTIVMEKSDLFDKCDKEDKQFQMMKRIKKMAFELKQYKIQPFDLKQLEENQILIKNNRKFATLLDSLKMYNQKILQNREHDIVNYKLYDFFYSTLKICNNKTESQVQFYLKEVDKWLSQYKSKRDFAIHFKEKKQPIKADDIIVRQTFKSNLPLEIDQYERKLLALPGQKSRNVSEMGEYLQRRQNKYKSTAIGMNDESDDSDTQNFGKKLADNADKANSNNQQIELPNLRAYRMQVLRMRKVIQQRQQRKLLQNLRKNQSRIITQSSNNFYKPLRNRNDIFNKTTAAWSPNDQLFKSTYGYGSNDGFNKRTSSQTPLIAKDLDKQNHRIIVNSTSLGFEQIKKKNLNKVAGLKKIQPMATLPKFFTTTMYMGEKLQSVIDNQSETMNNQDLIQPQVVNIEGLNLIKNPFEVLKTKNKKKK